MHQRLETLVTYKSLPILALKYTMHRSMLSRYGPLDDMRTLAPHCNDGPVLNKRVAVINLFTAGNDAGVPKYPVSSRR